MRARNIKPGFWANEKLGSINPMARLTFIGLWCLADKEGILENRPERIKAQLFPYDPKADVNGYVTVLEEEGFVSRYTVNGQNYIQVVNFHKHQSPHHTEKAKNYPKPDSSMNSDGCRITVTSPLRNALNHESGIQNPDVLNLDSPARKARAKKTPCPDKIEFTNGMHNYAREHQLDLNAQWAKCRDHHKFKGTMGLDWQKGFWTWLHNAPGFDRTPKKERDIADILGVERAPRAIETYKIRDVSE